MGPGTYQMPDQGTGDFRDFCRTCGASEKKAIRQPFVWFKQE